MSAAANLSNVPSMPSQMGLFYGGAWHMPTAGGATATHNPGTGEVLCQVPVASAQDAVAAIAAARRGFDTWREVKPLERAKILRAAGAAIRERVDEVAMLDSLNGGNPVSEMGYDVLAAAETFDFCAGLVTEIKGASIPMGTDAVNFSVREPLGVVARIVGFNHPFMFSAGRIAAPLAAGNAVIIKPPEQAPLSAILLADILGDLLPAGVLSILPGAADVGATLSSHPGVDMVTLIGSIPTGRAVYRAAADTIKPVVLELGGKNALIACADADPDEVAEAAVRGMNYTWCGQSCGSTSRLLLHREIYESVLERIPAKIARYRPGVPTDPATTMGAIISARQHANIMGFIASAKEQGARLIHGGKRPDDPRLARGNFIEPTVFADVTPEMRIAREEIFGPVQAVLPWSDEAEMLEVVNGLEYGLTCAIFTDDLDRAHRIAGKVEVGYVWVNTVGSHFVGAPFGGAKQSGIGRDECLAELLSFTREKNIHIKLRAGEKRRSDKGSIS